MDDFRRWILGITDALALIIIILITLTFGLWGAASGALGGAFTGNTQGAALIGMLIGGAIGFVVSATAASIALSLTEVARNTRLTLEILQSSQRKAEQTPQYTNVRKEVTPEAMEVLERAKEHGFTMDVNENETEIQLSKKGWGSQRFRSNAELEKFGKQMRWT